MKEKNRDIFRLGRIGIALQISLKEKAVWWRSTVTLDSAMGQGHCLGGKWWLRALVVFLPRSTLCLSLKCPVVI